MISMTRRRSIVGQPLKSQNATFSFIFIYYEKRNVVATGLCRRRRFKFLAEATATAVDTEKS